MMASSFYKTIGLALLFSLSLVVSSAQKLYQVIPDAEEKKLFMGIITVADIKGDTSFKWYAETLKYYRPNKELVDAFKAKSGQFQLVIFAGTWCHDSQAILPKYIACAEAAGLADSVITIIGTDRQKATLANLHKVFNVTLVPTMIVMKEGKEVGRITEYGNTGLPDAELAALLGKLD
jgi:thiol-disulfide isomerase/thioredoxin